MTKEFELFKKLVELALNNPNEHESNAAALKACKVAKENEFFKNLQSSAFGVIYTADWPSTTPYKERRKRAEQAAKAQQTKAQEQAWEPEYQNTYGPTDSPPDSWYDVRKAYEDIFGKKK